MGKKRKSNKKGVQQLSKKSAFSSFRLVSPAHRAVVVVGLFISSIFELFGYAIIVPLLASLAGNGGAELSGKKGVILEALKAVTGFFGMDVNIWSMIILVAAGLTMKSIISILVMLYVSHIMSDMTSNVRISLIRNLMNVRWNFFTRQPLARFIHGVGGDTSAIGDSFYGAANLIAVLMQILAYLVLSFIISWQLSLVSIGIGAFMILTYGHLVNRTRNAGKDKRFETRRMVSAFSDAIQGIKPIKAMGRHARIAVLFEKDNKAVSIATRNKVINVEFASEFQEPVVGVAIVIGLYLASTYWGVGLHEQFVIALILIKMIASINSLQKTHARIDGLKDQYSAAVNLLQETNKAKEDVSGSIVPTLREGIKFEEVSFSYPNKHVLNNVSFQIPAGKITTLAGPSGAGKTTIGDLILRLYHPQKGRVFIDQVDINQVDLLKWRGMIGYVPQDIMLFHDTIFHNVTLGTEEYDRNVAKEALVAAGAWDFVSSLKEGMDYVVGERGLLLSGGQRQRIAIARALLHKPSFLIMDEATTALDPVTEQAICRHVAELCRNRGLTILAVSHQPAWRQIADQVLEVAGGNVVPTARTPSLSVINGEL